MLARATARPASHHSIVYLRFQRSTSAPAGKFVSRIAALCSAPTRPACTGDRVTDSISRGGGSPRARAGARPHPPPHTLPRAPRLPTDAPPRPAPQPTGLEHSGPAPPTCTSQHGRDALPDLAAAGPVFDGGLPRLPWLC